jgi:hypothetical protein
MMRREPVLALPYTKRTKLLHGRPRRVGGSKEGVPGGPGGRRRRRRREEGEFLQK